MATECCSFPSIIETIGKYSFCNHEIRLYRTCTASFINSEVRRKWWYHVAAMQCLPFHLSPLTAPRSWHAFVSWRDYVYRIALPVNPSRVDIDSDENLDGFSEQSVWSESSGDNPFTVPEWLMGLDARGGPPCEHCGQLACVHRSETKGLVCARCLQSECIDQLIGYWGNLHRNHCILSNTTLARNIAEHMYGDGLAAYCYCGECNPNWFLYGWVCCPSLDTIWSWGRPDRNILAWRRSACTPRWELTDTE